MNRARRDRQKANKLNGTKPKAASRQKGLEVVLSAADEHMEATAPGSGPRDWTPPEKGAGKLTGLVRKARPGRRAGSHRKV
jgi:hypothetical protein